jgi:hypothetical protein
LAFGLDQPKLNEDQPKLNFIHLKVHNIGRKPR